MPIEFHSAFPAGAADLDMSYLWRKLPYDQRMVYIATMARHWAKTI